MNSFMANPDKIERKWYVVDAEGCTLGRLASEVASVLRGKNKPVFTPHQGGLDFSFTPDEMERLPVSCRQPLVTQI